MDKIKVVKAEAINAQMNCVCEQIKIMKQHNNRRLIYKALIHYRELNNQLNLFTPKFRQL